jgi:hypothetical protein
MCIQTFILPSSSLVALRPSSICHHQYKVYKRPKAIGSYSKC